LVRHQYGFDEKVYFPGPGSAKRAGDGLKVLFAGGCAPRKGLHYALRAWLESSAHKNGTLLIAGSFVKGYRENLSEMLEHPSVQILGHRQDLPEVMRACDALILPSVEEGSALVTYEARGSGCVLLVSEASGAMCRQGVEGLVHQVRDVHTLAQHLTMINEDRNSLETLRRSSMESLADLTWHAAGMRLTEAYEEVIQSKPLVAGKPQRIAAIAGQR
jgi:glycosyltransferase involved in cell wall biosynthesis